MAPSEDKQKAFTMLCVGLEQEKMKSRLLSCENLSGQVHSGGLELPGFLAF